LIQGPLDRRRYTLPAQRRIRRKPDFVAVQTRGRRFGNALFGVTLRANEADGPRLGLAVSVKVAGSGVERNRIRRTIRESFRLHQHELPAADLVVSARSRARGATKGELRVNLQALWSEVVKQCATLQKP
jgi:ribonuclease P protein component